MNDVLYVYDSKQLMFSIKSWTVIISKISGTPAFSIHFKTCHAYKHDLELFVLYFFTQCCLYLRTRLFTSILLGPNSYCVTAIVLLCSEKDGLQGTKHCFRKREVERVFKEGMANGPDVS